MPKMAYTLAKGISRALWGEVRQTTVLRAAQRNPAIRLPFVLPDSCCNTPDKITRIRRSTQHIASLQENFQWADHVYPAKIGHFPQARPAGAPIMACFA